jgi:ribonuclease D
VKKEIYNNIINFYYLDNQTELNNFCEILLDYNEIAIDTEFTRRNTYYPIISTIQIAVKKNSDPFKILALIDLKSSINIDKFMDIIYNKNIIKIFHASIQDLQIFYEIHKKHPVNIVDTQIMASFADYQNNISYFNLVKEIINVEISKEQQLSDWQKRPLTQLQINYALSDVLFLHEIYQYLNQKLIVNNRKEWFLENMQDFVNVSLDEDNQSYLKHFSYRNKTPLQIDQIKKIAILREKYAKILDIPREHLLKNALIENIVAEDSFIQKININKDFLREIKIILANKQLPININNDFLLTQKNENYKKIKSLVSKIAIDLNINEQLLINNKQIINIIKSNDVKNNIASWKYKIFGSEIEKILN